MFSFSFRAQGPENPRDAAGWALNIATAAQTETLLLRDEFPLECPVSLYCEFKLSTPRSLKRPREHITLPDLFRLQQAVRDGLKGIIIRRPSQVNTITASKSYSDTQSRVDIQVRYEKSKLR